MKHSVTNQGSSVNIKYQQKNICVYHNQTEENQRQRENTERNQRKKKKNWPLIEEKGSELQQKFPQEPWNQEDTSKTIKVLEKVNQPQVQ